MVRMMEEEGIGREVPCEEKILCSALRAGSNTALGARSRHKVPMRREGGTPLDMHWLRSVVWPRLKSEWAARTRGCWLPLCFTA